VAGLITHIPIHKFWGMTQPITHIQTNKKKAVVSQLIDQIFSLNQGDDM
jgi:hypothetical protein